MYWNLNHHPTPLVVCFFSDDDYVTETGGEEGDEIGRADYNSGLKSIFLQGIEGTRPGL